MLSFKVQCDGSTDNRSYQGDDPYIFGMTPSRDVLSPMCTSACICLHTLVSYLIGQYLKGMNKLNVSIEQWRNGRSCCILFWRAFLTGKIVVSWKSRKRIPGSCFWLKIYIKFFLVKDHFLRIKETCHIFILSKNRQIRKCLFFEDIR